ncbi:hypothetical protein AB0K47_05160 [Streptomyces tirandamycinicus]
MSLPTPSLRPERRHPVAVLEGEGYVEVTLADVAVLGFGEELRGEDQGVTGTSSRLPQ